MAVAVDMRRHPVSAGHWLLTQGFTDSTDELTVLDMNNVHRVFRLYTKSVAADTQVTLNGNGGTPVADQYHILLSLDPASKVERMTYDAFNRMTQWTDGTDTEDHEDRHEEWVRVRLDDGTTETNFLYDGDNVLADLVDSSFVKQYRGYVPPDGGSVRN